GLGKPSERLEALNGYVLTRQDAEAFQRRMYGGLLLSDDYLDDGIPCDGGADGIVRVVLERCVSVGDVFLAPSLQTPRQRAGELLCFNPMSGCRYRRLGVKYRLTTNEDINFALEDGWYAAADSPGRGRTRSWSGPRQHRLPRVSWPR